MIRRLIILLLIVGCVFAQDSTSADNTSDKNDILYLKDGTSFECVDTLTVDRGIVLIDTSGKIGLFFDVTCDNEIFPVELVDKMIFTDGRITTGNELVANKKKDTFWAYTITTSIVVLLVIITT